MNFFFKKKRQHDWGESLALYYLKKNGYSFVVKNFYTKNGDVDLIFFDNNILVFIEVKRKKSSQYGFPYNAVTLKKQKKIIEVSLKYIQSYQPKCDAYRFDIVSILGSEKKNCSIEHFPNAFDASSSSFFF